jgi:phenylacetate-CoA ligase
MRESQAEHPPFGDYLCCDESEVHHIHGTSGTTGAPTAFALGRRDWEVIADNQARILWGMGVRPGDTVFVAALFSLYLGSWGAMTAAERLRCRVLPFGAGAQGMTARAVNWLARVKPAAFYATPSYALRLAEVATEQGVDPADLGLRKLYFSGEPGASIPSIRGRIETAFGAQVYDSGSMAEVSPWMHLGAGADEPGVLCWQDLVYTEVCDPATLRRVPYGSEGTPVYTTLERTSQPMIRLLSNDLTRWEAPSIERGRTYPFLPRGIYGRIDDMFIVRGENIYPAAIDEVVMSDPGYGGEHRIVISRTDTMDSLVVQVEHQPGQRLDGWADGLSERLRRVLGVGATVVPVGRGTFERTEFKARRVLDDRDLLRSLSSESAP